jgi:hypothetical protein
MSPAERAIARTDVVELASYARHCLFGLLLNPTGRWSARPRQITPRNVPQLGRCHGLHVMQATMMDPTYKSIICAIVPAIIGGGAIAYFWQATAGSFASGFFFVAGLILFGRIFRVPARRGP